MSSRPNLSGRPFTPYDQLVSAEQRRGVYDLTGVNAERAPDYGRVDIRLDRTFTAGGRPLNLFVGVQNLVFPVPGLDWRFQ